MAFATAAITLPVVAIAWLHADALFERRLPWVSRPAVIVLDACIARWILCVELEKVRLRRDLPGKVRSRAFRCPVCDGPLPAWGGAFERCPTGPSYRWGDWGQPEGCFRLGCEACGRDVPFAAWLDGTVRPDPYWVSRFKYDIFMG